MSTTLSPIVFEAWSAASLSQYSLVATLVSILIGFFGLAVLQRLAYSTKWLARSPWRQWNTISTARAAAGAPAAAGVVAAPAAAGLAASAAGGFAPALC